MSELFQLLVMMAVPAAFLLLCRHLNLRGEGAPGVVASAVTVDASPSLPGATQCGPLTRRVIARQWTVRQFD